MGYFFYNPYYGLPVNEFDAEDRVDAGQPEKAWLILQAVRMNRKILG
jgi:hypothetical protein